MQTFIDDKRVIGTISKYIYGHFAEHLGRCIYGGFWVGTDSKIQNVNGIRSDVVEALKDINIPVLRWPGGCFADEYHWKDGIGDESKRKKMVNTNWGGVTENNHFGTHEYFELCRQLGCDSYINGNVGSGTVQEMQEWVEYMTMNGISPMADLRAKNGHSDPWRVKFFGVGNESWGCGGNMRPSFYADQYRQYQTFVRNYDADHPIYKIACGPNIDDYQWMDEVLKIAAPYMDGISLHHYALTGPWEDKGTALNFPENQWFSLIKSAQKMDELITKHSTIMDRYDPEQKIGLIVDEWGSWLKVEAGTNPGFLYQQNTIRDAMVAAVTLHIFQKHANRVYMANIAQTVNVLQSMILTENDKMIKTPTYYVFKMFKDHQNAVAIDTVSTETVDTISQSVSQNDNGYLISICNFALSGIEQMTYHLPFMNQSNVSGEILIGKKMDAHNSFEHPDEVKTINFDGFDIQKNQLVVDVPAMSVVTIHVNK